MTTSQRQPAMILVCKDKAKTITKNTSVSRLGFRVELRLEATFSTWEDKKGCTVKAV